MLDQTRHISFPYDPNKAAQAVLWLLSRHGGSMDKFKLIKLVFLVDWNHLIRYGRPIVGGTYFALPYGPVCSELKDYIDNATPSQNPPFMLQDVHNLVVKEATKEDQLSESELEILDEIYERYRHCDFEKLKEITHRFKVWDNNYPDKKVFTSNLMPYEDFFLDADPRQAGMLDLIREDQEARELLNT